MGILYSSLGAIIYVNPTATGNNDGSSWANAHTNLSQAIDNASNNTSNVDSLFVAEGIYIPDVHQTTNYPVFFCPPQMALFGGFPGTGNPTMANRDWQAYPTILEGDVSGDDDGTTATRTDNAKRLLIFDTFGRLDGVTVRNGGDDTGGVGAGLTLNGTNSRSAHIENCIFENNWVTNAGALAGEGGAVRGAAINPTDLLEMRNVVLHNNKAKFGAGCIYSGTGELNNCVFIGNEAELGSGVALSASGAGAGPGTLINCVFYNNTTVGGTNQGERSGVIGRLNPGSGDLTVWNSTFKDNAADSVAIVYSGLPLLTPAFTEFNNCLMDETNNLPAVALYEGDSVVMNNCVGSFTAGWSANATLGINDGLLTLSNWQEGLAIAYSLENTTDGVFVLDCDGPGHNAGLNSLLPASVASGTDLAGNPRILGGTVDVGAFEASNFDQPEIEQQGTVLQVTNGPYDNYQWLQDGVPVSGANTNMLSITENGNYVLIASNNGACGTDSSMVLQVTDQPSTGIAEHAQAMVRVWPNPATNVVQLRSNVPVQRVALYNLSGQQYDVAMRSGNQIDLGHLAPGIYVLEVQIEVGTSVHRLVKL